MRPCTESLWCAASIKCWWWVVLIVNFILKMGCSGLGEASSNFMGPGEEKPGIGEPGTLEAVSEPSRVTGASVPLGIGLRLCGQDPCFLHC